MTFPVWHGFLQIQRITDRSLYLISRQPLLFKMNENNNFTNYFNFDISNIHSIYYDNQV